MNQKKRFVVMCPCYGEHPEPIRVFKTLKRAEEFAKNVTDKSLDANQHEVRTVGYEK